ncbi:hypothetical protein MYX84_14105, partial [Acidobacteria bacterium AH-259-O06]|nr:hypothetical protein [Acidobacteria bacterium AH-259-O06]
MSHIAQNYLKLIPPADWQQLLKLATEQQSYITSIIENETGPRRKKMARDAYRLFAQTVITRTQPLAEAV